jgi:hypothetical protein
MALNLDFPTSPSTSYPFTGEPTNPNFLQQSLGSFWNQIFSEQGTIKGLTIGRAEELLQAYQDLTEAVYCYGVKDIPVYHKQIWQPLTIQKSLLNKSPFIFEQNGAVFGPQPTTDPLYANQVFQFGFPKSTSQFVYSITPNFTIGSFSLVTNQVFNPSVFYIAGVDVTLNDNVLYFNKNPFDNPKNTIIDIIGDTGVPVTYVDENGVTQQDQLLFLWVYNVKIDIQNLYKNFGQIFNINLPSSENYKDILKRFFNIAVGGCNILALKSLMAYIGGVVPVIEPQEVVQYVAVNEYNNVVVTDKNSYLFDLDSVINPSVIPGAIFYAGDTFVSLLTYYDTVSQKDWWKTAFSNNALVPFSSYLFLGNYQSQLFFPNSLQLITLNPAGVLNFPVEGSPADVLTFENYINEPVNKAAIIKALGLTSSSNPASNLVAYPLNPLDFIFHNFLKNNSACFVLNFASPDQTSTFFNLFDDIKGYLPKHVYFMMVINVSVNTEIYDNLNNCLSIAGVGTGLNCDGSDSNGYISPDSPYSYTNALKRLFSIGHSPLNSFGPLTNSYNLVKIGLNGTVYTGGAKCVAGKLFTTIPNSGATSQTVPHIKLIDFSP